MTAKRSVLEVLAARRAISRAKLDAALRAQRQIQARIQAEERRLKHRQWQAMGQLLESLGFPCDLPALQALLQAHPYMLREAPGNGMVALAGATGRAGSELSCSPPALPDHPAEPEQVLARDEG